MLAMNSLSPQSAEPISPPPLADLALPATQVGHFRLLGQSVAMAEVRARILRLAASNAPVTIYGESGSGKELAARDIHSHSVRASMPFVAVNCGAIPEALMEAEFFGYRKGAFTGATQEHDGFFQAAHRGTLLLDEVADLPLAMQVKLLRAIQERRVRKLGASNEDRVDVRIISASHQDLAQGVQQGSFRQDLYYRLNVISLQLPPLRSRREDILCLAESALLRMASPARPPQLSPAALAALCTYNFPGNVRELENILERALAFADGGVIEAADLDFGVALPEHPRSPLLAQAASASTTASTTPTVPTVLSLPLSLPTHLQDIERALISQALQQTRFNRTRAAALLGISFRQLRYRIQRLAIHDPD